MFRKERSGRGANMENMSSVATAMCFFCVCDDDYNTVYNNNTDDDNNNDNSDNNNNNILYKN